MAVRWETEVGPGGVKRVVRTPEGEALFQLGRVEQALIALATDVAAAAEQARDLAQETRAMLADARDRQAIRERLAATRAPVAPEAVGVTGAHVARARFLSQGISQKALAEELRLHRSQVAEAERGVRYVPEKLGLWAVHILRTAGEWPPPAPPAGAATA